MGLYVDYILLPPYTVDVIYQQTRAMDRSCQPAERAKDILPWTAAWENHSPLLMTTFCLKTLEEARSQIIVFRTKSSWYHQFHQYHQQRLNIEVFSVSQFDYY